MFPLSAKVLIFVEDVATYDLQSCECQSGPQVLVQNGLFPTAPAQPRIAVSLALLELYHALFERSCDAVNALSLALLTYYMRRGYRVLNRKASLSNYYMVSKI
jgi:hypothetical protein